MKPHDAPDKDFELEFCWLNSNAPKMKLNTFEQNRPRCSVNQTDLNKFSRVGPMCFVLKMFSRNATQSRCKSL